MSELTITLAGSEEKAEFSGGNAWLRNDGTDTVYAAKSAGITAGADGVVAIPAGQSAPVYDANGTVFLLGTGSVQLIGSDYSTNPFKTSAQSGGSGADSVARAAISAHAGNADIHVTAAEKAVWNAKADPVNTLQVFDVLTSGSLLDYALGSTASGYVFVKGTVTDTPIEGRYYFTEIRKYLTSCEVIATDFTYGTVSTNRYNGGSANPQWYGWKKTADDGNAATLNGFHANEIASNPNLLINPNFKINQRGSDEYSSEDYCVDGWRIYKDGKVTKTDSGIIISLKDGATTNGILYQKNEVLADYVGKDITLSVSVGDTVYSGNIVVPASAASAKTVMTPHGEWYLYHLSNNIIQVACLVREANTDVVNWVKVEIGSVATQFVSPDPATELAKCQRYYQIRTTNDVDPLDLRPSMRTITDIRQVTGGYAYVAEL